MKTWEEFIRMLEEKGGEVIVKADQLAKIMSETDMVEVIRCKDCVCWDRDQKMCTSLLVAEPNGYCYRAVKREY